MNGYEEMRDRERGPAGEEWREADREERRLRDLYASLQEDPRYTGEHKAERAWGTFLEAREKIEGGRRRAREALLKQARSAERLSLPLPDGATHQAKDASELLAAQNEAGRITRKAERLRAANPLNGGDKATPLREEYRRGLDMGGVEGLAICRGVLSAADELGVSADAVADEFRKPHHRESLERAQAARQAAMAIGAGISEPPFKRPPNVAAGSLRSVVSATARRPSWK